MKTQRERDREGERESRNADRATSTCTNHSSPEHDIFQMWVLQKLRPEIFDCGVELSARVLDRGEIQGDPMFGDGVRSLVLVVRRSRHDRHTSVLGGRNTKIPNLSAQTWGKQSS